jgi:hypothetical protein
MIGADGSDMAIGAGYEADRVGPGSRRRERGSVMIEFALSFPILLVLFAFAWQMLNMYNADILGSYATFSAARSYSVFRYAEGFTAQDAVHIARDVAVVAMSPVSSSVKLSASDPFVWHSRDSVAQQVIDNVDFKKIIKGINLDDVDCTDIRSEVKDIAFQMLLGALEQGLTNLVEQCKDMLKREIIDIAVTGEDEGANALAAERAFRLLRAFGQSPNSAEAAWGSMTNFSIVEYSSEPPKIYTITAGGTVHDDTMYDALAHHYFSVPLAEGYRYDGDFTNARIAQVSFTYDLPLWMGFVHMNTFRPATAQQKKYRPSFALYQSSAAPIEPNIITADADPLDEPGDNRQRIEDLERDLDLIEIELKEALTNLRDEINRVYAVVHGPGSVFLNRDTWTNAPPWSDDNPPPDRLAPATINAAVQHSAFDDQGMKNFHNIYNMLSHERPDERALYVAVTAWRNAGPPLHDIKQVLYDEWFYRSDVITNIQVEIKRQEVERDDAQDEVDALDEAKPEEGLEGAALAQWYEDQYIEIEEWKGLHKEAEGKILKWEAREKYEDEELRGRLQPLWNDINAKLENVHAALRHYYHKQREIKAVVDGRVGVLTGLLP